VARKEALMEKFENQKVQSTNQMLTPQEVSQLIKIAVGTLENWRRVGLSSSRRQLEKLLKLF
jgi:hypothetical protein